MDLLSTFYMAAIPVLKVLMCCGVGAYLALPSMNILTDDARKLLNRLVFIAFTPALVFSKLAKTVTYENIFAWWYMPFHIIMGYVFGAAMGMLVVKYTSVPPHLRNLTLACCAAGNTGNVPLVLVPAICQEKGSPFGRSEVCSENAVAYISYGLWIGIVLTWTFIYKLLRPPDFQENSSTAGPVIYRGSPHSSDFGEFQCAEYCDKMEDFDPRNTTFSASMINKPTNLSAFSSLPPPSYQMQVPTNMSPRSLSSTAAPDITQDLKAYFFFIVEKYELKTVFTPPTSAAFLGLLIGGIPPLKYLFTGPFVVFVDSAEIIGEAMIPAMNMVLGASLVQGGGTSEFATSSIIGIIVVRLVALPIFAMISVTIVNSLGMLPADPLFRFVLLLQLTMPTAINIGTLSQLFCVGEKEAALVLLYAYLSAAVCITFWVVIYLEYFV